MKKGKSQLSKHLQAAVPEQVAWALIVARLLLSGHDRAAARRRWARW